jgi:hypothetical protein
VPFKVFLLILAYKLASWDLHALGFKAQRDQHLALMIYPYKSDEDLSFDVYDEKGNSILPWRNEWIRWLRLIYILLFGLAIIIMFRAFLRFGRREKLIAKNPNNN